MALARSTPSNLAYSSSALSTAMPAPEIPIRRMPRFLLALWVLAALVVFGLIYSFWRISSVATPKLDVPATPQTISNADN